MELTQRLVGETPIDELVSMAKTLAQRLRGESIDFVEARRVTTSDRNYVRDLFDAAWTGPGVEVSAAISNGEGGNPRDGWGYDIDVALRIEPAGSLREPLTMTLRDGSMSQSVWSPTIRFRCASLDTFDRACAIVREALPGRRDETNVPPWSTSNAEALLRDGNERDARILVERCWSIESVRAHTGPEQPYWSGFLALRARLEPSSPASRGTRLREDPGALDEWLAISRGETTAEGHSRATALWCAALLSPYRPAVVAAIADERRVVQEPLARLRRAVAVTIATPAWFAVSHEDLAASRAAMFTAVAERDASDSGWFRVTDGNSDAQDAASIGGHASRALLAVSPLASSGIAAHQTESALVETPAEGHGSLLLAFEPRPGMSRAEWNAAWGDPASSGEVPVVWIDLRWKVNTRDTLYLWHWVWTDSPAQGACFVETRRARPGAPGLGLPDDHPLQGATGWIRGDTFMRVFGDARWRERVIETLGATPFVGLKCEPVDDAIVRW